MSKWKEFSKAQKIGLGFIVGFFGLVLIGVANPQPKNSTTNQQKAPALNAPQTIKVDSPNPLETTEVKTETTTESIPFDSQTENDATLTAGTTKIATQGVNGERTHTFKVTYVAGKETAREETANDITKQPTTQVTKVGTKKTVSTPSPSSSSCSNGYINSAGNCIPAPSSNPAGATAKCRDGTYSYSQSHSGTCSHHGGVAQWL